MKRRVIGMIILVFGGCIEPFEFETRDVGNILVVEAIITDKMETQRVLLKRADDLQNVNMEPPRVFDANIPVRPIEDLTNYEENAMVIVKDDMGNTFVFSEKEPGTYESTTPFAAEQTKSYQLQISTIDNEEYESSFMSPVGDSKLENIYAERIVNENGEEGMAIYVDGSDAMNMSDYFRYTYEETYKIIAPNWTPLEFEIVREEEETSSDGTILYPAVNLIPRSVEEQICYNTINSSDINLVSTAALEQSISKRTLVRFIDRDDAILSHRYSILISQYIHSLDAFSYYENLKNFASSSSVFSEIQPGFLEGNVKSKSDERTVIGYFDVASVNRKRLFFSYSDFFPGEDLPPYFFDFNCDRLLVPTIGDPELDGSGDIELLGCSQFLIPRIKLGLVEYVAVNENPQVCEGPYFVTQNICGDCTILGSNVKPEFWVE